MFKIILISTFLLTTNEIFIGEISFKVVQKGTSDRRYIWLHGDEQTAKMALENHMSSNQGIAYFIKNNKREVYISEAKIDPKRIFTSIYPKKKINKFNHKIQIGFNRRFDLSHAKVQKACLNKEIGNLEMVVITSRDPQPPSMDYLKAAGGFFRDTTIHDFDLARFILGDDPIIQVSAFGSQLISEDVKKVNDHDTAMFILKSKSGVLIHINNSRRAVYGYDQRVEIFGSKGMTVSYTHLTLPTKA